MDLYEKGFYTVICLKNIKKTIYVWCPDKLEIRAVKLDFCVYLRWEISYLHTYTGTGSWRQLGLSSEWLDIGPDLSVFEIIFGWCRLLKVMEVDLIWLSVLVRSFCVVSLCLGKQSPVITTVKN